MTRSSTMPSGARPGRATIPRPRRAWPAARGWWPGSRSRRGPGERRRCGSRGPTTTRPAYSNAAQGCGQRGVQRLDHRRGATRRYGERRRDRRGSPRRWSCAPATRRRDGRASAPRDPAAIAGPSRPASAGISTPSPVVEAEELEPGRAVRPAASAAGEHRPQQAAVGALHLRQPRELRRHRQPPAVAGRDAADGGVDQHVGDFAAERRAAKACTDSSPGGGPAANGSPSRRSLARHDSAGEVTSVAGPSGTWHSRRRGGCSGAGLGAAPRPAARPVPAAR